MMVSLFFGVIVSVSYYSTIVSTGEYKSSRIWGGGCEAEKKRSAQALRLEIRAFLLIGATNLSSENIKSNFKKQENMMRVVFYI